MSTILITGARAPIALDLARSFAAAGHTPHLADSIYPWAARLSGAAPLHRLPSPRFNFPAFQHALTQLVERLNPRLVLPTCEEVFYVSEAAHRAGFTDRVFAPPPAALRQLHSKVEFAALATAAGLQAPTTTRATSREYITSHAPNAANLVFKPEFSRFATRTLIRPTPADLARITPTPAAPWAVQDFIPGEELCIWSAAISGELKAFAAYRPLWRLGRSASFYFEPVSDPALLEAASAIAKHTNATGQLSYDVIRTAGGAIVPIECNPRGVSGVHLFGANPDLARALLNETRLTQPPPEPRCLTPAMWLLGAPQALASGRLNQFRADLARSRNVSALSGAAPIGALMDASRFALVGLTRGRSASGQSTDDIEWNGEPIP